MPIFAIGFTQLAHFRIPCAKHTVGVKKKLSKSGPPLKLRKKAVRWYKKVSESITNFRGWIFKVLGRGADAHEFRTPMVCFARSQRNASDSSAELQRAAILATPPQRHQSYLLLLKFPLLFRNS